jgi:hypothetical protein
LKSKSVFVNAKGKKFFYFQAASVCFDREVTQGKLELEIAKAKAEHSGGKSKSRRRIGFLRV